MKKNYSLFLLIIILLFSVMSIYSEGQAEETEKVYVMKVATEDPAGSVNHPPFEFVKTFNEEVEKLSGGRIKVEFYPGRQLGAGEELMNQVRNGNIQACLNNDGVVSSIYPPLQVAQIPYAFSDREVAWRVLDGPVGKELSDDMAKKTGVRVLHWSENGGFRHYSNNVREIRTPDDMKGLKIRTMNVPLHMQIVKDLGASPTPISWSELYTALQTGVVDGQENAIPTFLLPNLEEVQDYMTLDGHVYGAVVLSINEKWFQGLPEDLKQAVIDAEAKGNEVCRRVSVEQEQVGLEYLLDYGLKVYDPTFEEKNMFRDATQESAIEFLSSDKKVGEVWVNKILDEVDRVERELGYK